MHQQGELSPGGITPGLSRLIYDNDTDSALCVHTRIRDRGIANQTVQCEALSAFCPCASVLGASFLRGIFFRVPQARSRIHPSGSIACNSELDFPPRAEGGRRKETIESAPTRAQLLFNAENDDSRGCAFPSTRVPRCGLNRFYIIALLDNLDNFFAPFLLICLCTYLYGFRPSFYLCLIIIFLSLFPWMICYGAGIAALQKKPLSQEGHVLLFQHSQLFNIFKMLVRV